jgi:hypothetical protein
MGTLGEFSAWWRDEDGGEAGRPDLDDGLDVFVGEGGRCGGSRGERGGDGFLLSRGELGREDGCLELLRLPVSRGAGLDFLESPFSDEEEDLGESDGGVCCFDEADEEVLSLPPLAYAPRRADPGGEASRLLLSDLAWLSRTLVLRSSLCKSLFTKLYRAGLRSVRRWDVSESASASESSKTSSRFLVGDGGRDEARCLGRRGTFAGLVF